MKFKLTIETDNAAFLGDRTAEIARILRELADKIEQSGDCNQVARDVNGDRVGGSELKR